MAGSSDQNTAAQPAKKLWGGRFRADVDPLMEKFNESLSFDRRMWKEDIEGSKAYARGLAKTKLITDQEATQIADGLDQTSKEWENGTFEVKAGDEDIHTANERRLSELIGPLAGKLHTGRSRNDQVATDIRLWLRQKCDSLDEKMGILLSSLCDLSETYIDLLMPGFTHLQPAQPVRFSHWVMSHAAALKRDVQRLRDARIRVNICPLGSGALAGNSFGVDRVALAEALGFDGVTSNSLDAVCDRDHIVEMMFWASMTMTHLSQLSEDLIVYNFQKFITMSDAYSTGSSLMPQKKNPDAAELLRGKAGRVMGRMIGLMSTLKGLPRSYNKDLQEDKEPLFDCIDTMEDCLLIAAGMMSTLTPNKKAMEDKLVTEMLATDLAEYLVRKGVPFRETHHIAGAAVRMAEDRNCALSDLTVDHLKSLHKDFEEDVVEVWNYETSVERKDVVGGTSKSAVLQQISDLRKFLADGTGC